jgi:PTH1 family peptidyl-tRNA hydrolase
MNFAIILEKIINSDTITIMKYIVGLGNPDEQYQGTRHNIGREIVEKFAKKHKFPAFEYDKKSDTLVSVGKYEYIPTGKKTKKKADATLILPETYMNKSGSAVKKFVTSKKKVEMMTVVYDDLDLGIGTTKMNFNKGSGGHKGIDSIIRSVKTKAFNRLRVGISKSTPTGKIKKPSGEEAVVKHVLGKFSPAEQTEIKKVMNRAVKGIELVLEEGRVKATNIFN